MPIKKLNIAHRGARSVAPENTLVAARKAKEVGADFWELDVQLTRDKQLVLMHDSTLCRTTDVEKLFPERESYKVSDFDLAEIKDLDAGSWYAETDPFEEIEKGNVSRDDLDSYKGRRVPTLREALEVTGELGLRVNIEIKEGDEPPMGSNEYSETISNKVISVIESLNMFAEVIVSSFNTAIVKKTGELSSGIRRAILVNEPEPDPLNLLRELKVQNYNLSKSGLTTDQGIANIKEIGRAEDDSYGVIVWTVNEHERLKELVTNPFISGIITDYPQRLTRILAKSV